MLRSLSLLVDYFAPLFLIVSPVTSYADQIASIHRSKTSDGFSLDIPLIMLVASILKIFYWFGAYYSVSLLVQSTLMIIVQLTLLKVSLDNRPPAGKRDGVEHAPFSAYGHEGLLRQILSGKRPYHFWQWPTPTPYYQFLLYLTLILFAIHVFLPPVSSSAAYISLLGYVGLAIEALLPIPQILKNQHARSCRGFRLSVIGNWLLGDSMKMSYFFFSTELIPWAFKLSGIFQMGCDLYLGFQYYLYGAGPEVGSIPMPEMSGGLR